MFFTRESRHLASEKNILGGEEEARCGKIIKLVKNSKIMKTHFLHFLAHPVYFANLLLVCKFSLHKYVDHTVLKILSGQPFL